MLDNVGVWPNVKTIKYPFSTFRIS